MTLVFFDQYPTELVAYGTPVLLPCRSCFTSCSSATPPGVARGTSSRRGSSPRASRCPPSFPRGCSWSWTASRMPQVSRG
jgi:hypothetical protein